MLYYGNGTAEASARRIRTAEPRARGLGIGKRLVSECTRFARQVRYRKITLWTNNVLREARQIYAREGYQLIDQQPHESFGPTSLEEVTETWELEL